MSINGHAFKIASRCYHGSRMIANQSLETAWLYDPPAFWNYTEKLEYGSIKKEVAYLCDHVWSKGSGGIHRYLCVHYHLYPLKIIISLNSRRCLFYYGWTKTLTVGYINISISNFQPTVYIVSLFYRTKSFSWSYYGVSVKSFFFHS